VKEARELKHLQVCHLSETWGGGQRKRVSTRKSKSERSATVQVRKKNRRRKSLRRIWTRKNEEVRNEEIEENSEERRGLSDLA